MYKFYSFLFPLLFLISCAQENIVSPKENQEQDIKLAERTVHQSVKDLIEHTSGHITMKDQKLLSVGESLKASFSSSNVREELKNILLSKNSNEISIVEWQKITEHKGLNELFLEKSISRMDTMSDETIEIFHPNLETADASKLPIIGIGSEINFGEDSVTYDNDIIAAWILDENERTIYLDEEFAITSEYPIYIVTTSGVVDVSDSFNDDDSYQEIEETENGRILDNSLDVRIKGFNITKRYDNSKRSEYSYKLVYVYSGGTWQKGGNREEIWEVHKDNIGRNHSCNFDIWQLEHVNVVRFHIVTFEYDWFAGKKDVNFGSNIYATDFVRMSNSNEWYQIGYYDWVAGEKTIESKGFIKINLSKP